MSTNGKRDWFQKVFRLNKPPPNPQKLSYQQQLKQCTPIIEQCAKRSSTWKRAMSLRLAEVKKLAKEKNYEQAIQRLQALQLTARRALDISLIERDNEHGDLQRAAELLTRLRSIVELHGLQPTNPTMEDAERAIRNAIEEGDHAQALTVAQPLIPRFESMAKACVEALRLYKGALERVKLRNVELPSKLKSTFEGADDLARRGKLEAMKQLVDTVDRYLEQPGLIGESVQQIEDLARKSKAVKEGDLARQSVQVWNQLANNGFAASLSQIEVLRSFVDKEIRTAEALRDGLEDTQLLVKDLGLQPGELELFQRRVLAVDEALSNINLDEADRALGRLRDAIAPAAERLRIGQVLERLVDEEKSLHRIDPNLLSEQAEAVRRRLNDGDGPGAQIELKKIQDAIAHHLDSLSGSEREQAEQREVERQFGNRLQRLKQEAERLRHDDTLEGEALQRLQALNETIEQYEKIEHPLNPERQAQAMTLYTRALVQSGKGRFSKGGGTANSTLMLKSRDPLTGGSKLKQIFKPVSGESSQPGFPKGGGACREVVGKRLADKLRAMTGMQINVAETHLVELPPDAMPPGTFTEPVVGSIQHNVHRKGDAVQLSLADVHGSKRTALLEKLPQRQVQSKQVYDLVFLNLDVHAGNVLVKGEGENAEIDGIDNGMGLPSKEGLILRAEAFGMHALGEHPDNSGMFSEEMREAIRKMDPEALGQSVQDSFADLKKQFPNSEATGDDKLNDEHVGLMKASVRFLKRAAGELTINELHNAYLVNTQDIFGLRGEEDDRDEETRFNEVIEAAKARGKALQTCLANETQITQKALETGWMFTANPPRGSLVPATLLRFYPAQYLEIWQSENVEPCSLPVPPPQVAPVQPQDATELEKQLFQSLMNRPAAERDAAELGHVRAYLALGGDARTQSLGGALSASALYNTPSGRHALLNRLMVLRERMQSL